MNICILSAYEDSMNYDTGYSVRITNLAKGLQAQGNNVSVILPKFTTSRKLVKGVPVYELNGLCPSFMLKFIGKIGKIQKPSALYLFDAVFASRISQVAKEADIVQLELPPLSVLLTFLLKKAYKKKVAIDCHDVFQALRIKNGSLPRRFIETCFEKMVLKNADLLIAVSEREKQILLSMGFPSHKIFVAPNGVDTESFQKSSNSSAIREKYGLKNSKVVVFVGHLGYTPNLEAIQLISSVIAPKVKKELGDVVFLVVGKMRNATVLPGLVFTGYVENVSDLLGVADVGIAPLLHGAGTRLKILEYLSSGLPVVSTSVGAEGLSIENGSNIFIDDDLEEFTDHVIKLLKDPSLSTRMGEAGKNAAKNYDWKNITGKLEIDFQSFLVNNVQQKF